jgi:hypothetical protein
MKRRGWYEDALDPEVRRMLRRKVPTLILVGLILLTGLIVRLSG